MTVTVNLADGSRALAITLIKATTDEVSAAIDLTLASWNVGERFARYQSDSASTVSNIKPIPGGAHRFKLALFSTRKGQQSSALVVNLEDGYRSLAIGLATRLKCLQIQLLSTAIDAYYPRHSFEMWQDGESRRIVRSLKDDNKWEFFERGDPQSFERIELYKEKLIKSRVTRPLLTEYARTLGWSFDDFTAVSTTNPAFIHERDEIHES